MNRDPRSRDCEDLYLPNLCGIRTVFAAVVITQLFAFVLALAPLEAGGAGRWTRLGLLSLFMQWITLFSCSVLCLVRPYLCRLGAPAVTAVAMGILLAITALFTELTYHLYYVPVYGYGHDWHLRFLGRNLVIAAIVSGLVLRYFYVQQQWRRNLRAESEARLEALQARIRPHFLFNSMNTIAALTRSAPAKAEAAVENLADLFRASLSDARALIPLEEELALCRRYLDIEQLRLGDRLRVQWSVGELPPVRVPPLTLQPLVENAIYHGIETRGDGGTVEIGAEAGPRSVTVTVRNPRGGEDGHGQGNRLALANIRQRLAAHFGPGEHLKIRETAADYAVSVTLPVAREDTG